MARGFGLEPYGQFPYGDGLFPYLYPDEVLTEPVQPRLLRVREPQSRLLSARGQSRLFTKDG